MTIDGKKIAMDIAGIGIVFHSPSMARHIAEGEDYLTDHYTTEDQVQSHIQSGSIVGFGTGSPGTFVLEFREGYPSEAFVKSCQFKLRLGLICVGGEICFRDLYDLMDWQSECSPSRTLALDDGIYHVTLCSEMPKSGFLGDDQVIFFFLAKLTEFPKLQKQGIPTLCM